MGHRAGRLILVAAAAASTFACGLEERTTRAVPESSVPVSPSIVPGRDVSVPRPIPLGRLPLEGLVVSDDRGILFVDVDGVVLERMDGFRFAGNPGAPGIWLRRGKQHFRLDVGRGRLTPIPRDVLRRKDLYDEGPEPGLPPPDVARLGGRIAGHWRFAYRSGTRTLAQWSGECELPTAFWVEGDSQRIVTGERKLEHAPKSVALGWSKGEALVILEVAYCGTTAGRPGIYRFRAPGEGILIFETKGDASAELW